MEVVDDVDWTAAVTRRTSGCIRSIESYKIRGERCCKETTYALKDVKYIK